jgi:hypothetical protein
MKSEFCPHYFKPADLHMNWFWDLWSERQKCRPTKFLDLLYSFIEVQMSILANYKWRTYHFLEPGSLQPILVWLMAMHDPMLRLQPSYPSQWDPVLFCASFSLLRRCSNSLQLRCIYASFNYFWMTIVGARINLFFRTFDLLWWLRFYLGSLLLPKISMRSFLLFSFLFKLGLWHG